MSPDRETEKTNLRNRMATLVKDLSDLGPQLTKTSHQRWEQANLVRALRAGVERLTHDGPLAEAEKKRLAAAEEELAQLSSKEKAIAQKLEDLTEEREQCKTQLAVIEGSEDVEYRLQQHRERQKALSDTESRIASIKQDKERLSAELKRQRVALMDAERQVDGAADIAAVEEATAAYEHAMRTAENTATLHNNVARELPRAEEAAAQLRHAMELARRGVWEAKRDALMDEAREGYTRILRAYAAACKADGYTSFSHFLGGLAPGAKSPDGETIEATAQELIGEIGGGFAG